MDLESPEVQSSLGCLLKLLNGFLYGIVWLFVYGATLGSLSSLLVKRFVESGSVEGYGAFVTMVGPLVVMPIGLLLSCVALALLKRKWIFFLLAAIAGAATAVMSLIAPPTPPPP